MAQETLTTLDDYIREVGAIQDYKSSSKFYDAHMKKFKEFTKTLKEDDWEKILELTLISLWKGSYISEFALTLLDKRKLFNLKKHPEIADRIFDNLRELGEVEYKDHAAINGPVNNGIGEKLITIIKAQKLLDRYTDKMCEVVMTALMTEKNYLTYVCFKIVAEIPFLSCPEWINKFFERIYEIVTTHVELSESADLSSLSDMVTMFIFQKLNISGGRVKINGKYTDEKPTGNVNGVGLSKEFMDLLLRLFNFCKDQEFLDPDDSDHHTLQWVICKNIMEDFLYRNHGKPDVIRPFLPAVKELWDSDDEIMQRDADNIMTAIGGNADLMGEDTTDTIIESYFNGDNPHIITSFQQLYPQCPEKFNGRVSEFLAAMAGSEDWVALTTMGVLHLISKSSPESFSKDDIRQMFDALNIENADTLAFMAIGHLIEFRPDELVSYDEEVIAYMRRKEILACQGGTALVHLATTKERATKYLQVIREVCDNVPSMYQMGLLYNMRSIGQKYTDELAEHEEWIRGKKEIQALAEHAQGLLDIIAGRTLVNISEEVQKQGEDIINLDDRVTNTEENVDNLGKEVDTNKADIKGLQTDVNSQGERLGDLEEVVDETVDKVEEIDRKTLSHAPSWSRAVSKLLNPESEHDWRLLSSRLGYTPDDIRNWATQPDPCLSMLDEWFATHKTREATYAVMRMLQEINRLDAAAIVEEALKSVEDVIDEEPEELESPPDVFISYQWGHQPEVKLLKKHLEMAGYKSWMDIGQMGGGDKLFQKIDLGIRAAKIIICCVSEKYAKSDNCNREVNLSVTLGKPIIPLLMERIPWPPPGAMGPIFGEYLFIRFFQRPGEESPDIRYWPLPKFNELLVQLRYSIPPDETLIQEEYKDWWKPPEEIIIIKPKEQLKIASRTNSGQSEDKERTSPQIFISYQWGKQPQIKALFSRLSKLGFTCWLDIMQMGGGDSLYDKIDRGIRGCKVVISCVTTKYALSANCKREVSLADAIKKPIIPLLLEKMAWPPEGPMGMVFTQLLYINFCKPNADIQNNWECQQFEELLQKVYPYVRELPIVEEKINETQNENLTQPERGPPEEIQNYSTALENNIHTKPENHTPDKTKQEIKKSFNVETTSAMVEDNNRVESNVTDNKTANGVNNTSVNLTSASNSKSDETLSQKSALVVQPSSSCCSLQ